MKIDNCESRRNQAEMMEKGRKGGKSGQCDWAVQRLRPAGWHSTLILLIFLIFVIFAQHCTITLVSLALVDCLGLALCNG